MKNRRAANGGARQEGFFFRDRHRAKKMPTQVAVEAGVLDRPDFVEPA